MVFGDPGPVFGPFLAYLRVRDLYLGHFWPIWESGTCISAIFGLFRESEAWIGPFLANLGSPGPVFRPFSG